MCVNQVGVVSLISTDMSNVPKSPSEDHRAQNKIAEMETTEPEPGQRILRVCLGKDLGHSNRCRNRASVTSSYLQVSAIHLHFVTTLIHDALQIVAVVAEPMSTLLVLAVFLGAPARRMMMTEKSRSLQPHLLPLADFYRRPKWSFPNLRFTLLHR